MTALPKLNDGEEWRVVPGLEGRFEASSHGRIRRTEAGFYKSTRAPGSIVRNGVNKGGYWTFRATIHMRPINKHWHQIVALAFHGEPPLGMQVAHLDGNRLNNRPDNLAYVTPRENNSHKYAHGTLVRGEAVKTSKLSEADVLEIRASSEAPSALGRRFGINPRHVWRLRKHLQWTHIGGAAQ